MKAFFSGLPERRQRRRGGESASAEKDGRIAAGGISVWHTPRLISLEPVRGGRNPHAFGQAGHGRIDETVISDALSRHLGSGQLFADRYATPLSDLAPIPPVVSITGDIARYRLTGGDIRDTDPIRERYTKALNWLRDVADGRRAFPGPPPAGTETPGAVLLEPGTRPWDG